MKTWEEGVEKLVSIALTSYLCGFLLTLGLAHLPGLRQSSLPILTVLVAALCGLLITAVKDRRVFFLRPGAWAVALSSIVALASGTVHYWGLYRLGLDWYDGLNLSVLGLLSISLLLGGYGQFSGFLPRRQCT